MSCGRFKNKFFCFSSFHHVSRRVVLLAAAAKKKLLRVHLHSIEELFLRCETKYNWWVHDDDELLRRRGGKCFSVLTFGAIQIAGCWSNKNTRNFWNLFTVGFSFSLVPLAAEAESLKMNEPGRVNDGLDFSSIKFYDNDKFVEA